MLSGGPLDSFVPGEDSRAAGPPPGGAVSAPGTCWCCRSCKWVVTVSVRVPTSSGSDSAHPDTLAGPLFWLHNGSTQGTKLVTELVSRMLRLAIFCLICKFALLMKRIAGWRPGYEMKPFFPLFFSCSNRPLSGCNATNDPSDQNSSHSQRERRQNTNPKESLASNKNVSSAEVRVRADGENIFQKIVKNPQKFFKLIKLNELSLRIFFGLF